MNEDPSASKLRDRVSDWQSYLGRSDSPWSPTDSAAAAPVATVDTALQTPPAVPLIREEAPIREPEAVQPRTAEAAHGAEIAGTPSTAEVSSEKKVAVVEILPPESAPARFARNGNGAGSYRAFNASAHEDMHFPRHRPGSVEFDHTRKASAILSTVIVLLLGILSTVLVLFLIE